MFTWSHTTYTSGHIQGLLVAEGTSLGVNASHAESTCSCQGVAHFWGLAVRERGEAQGTFLDSVKEWALHWNWSVHKPKVGSHRAPETPPPTVLLQCLRSHPPLDRDWHVGLHTLSLSGLHPGAAECWGLSQVHPQEQRQHAQCRQPHPRTWAASERSVWTLPASSHFSHTGQSLHTCSSRNLTSPGSSSIGKKCDVGFRAVAIHQAARFGMEKWW